MQLEALWTVSFISFDANSTDANSITDSGSGVVIFETNRIFGGDSTFYYLGNFTNADGILEGNIQIKRHSPGDSILGTGDEFEFSLSGEYKEGEPEMILHGIFQADDVSTAVGVKLTYRAELP